MSESPQHQEMSSNREHVRVMASSILTSRAQLLLIGGDDAVVVDILELAAQIGSSYKTAAALFQRELDDKIAEARVQLRLGLGQRELRLSRHVSDISRLMAATGQGRSTVANLENMIKGWGNRQDERLTKLRNAGLNTAQIEDVLGHEAKLAGMKRDLEDARLKLANDEAEFAALQYALRHGRDHSQTVAA